MLRKPDEEPLSPEYERCGGVPEHFASGWKSEISSRAMRVLSRGGDTMLVYGVFHEAVKRGAEDAPGADKELCVADTCGSQETRKVQWEERAQGGPQY